MVVSTVELVNFSLNALEKELSKWVCFNLLMTQHIPQTKAGDALVLEISISLSPTQHRWDLWSALSPPAEYTAPLCQPSTISQLLFSFESKREAVCSDL